MPKAVRPSGVWGHCAPRHRCSTWARLSIGPGLRVLSTRKAGRATGTAGQQPLLEMIWYWDGALLLVRQASHTQQARGPLYEHVPRHGTPQ